MSLHAGQKRARLFAMALIAAVFSTHNSANQASPLLFDHVFVIVLENHSVSDGIDSIASPFLYGLSRTQGVATRYSGVTHPSLPNYLAMIGGDDFGIRDDDPSCFASGLSQNQPCHGVTGGNLVDQLEAAGRSWALFAEDLPPADPLVERWPAEPTQALYAQKHNPFAYFADIAHAASRLAALKPLSALKTDLETGATSFTFIVPNQCHDGHGLAICDDPQTLVRAYDAFVETTIAEIRRSPSWTEHSAIFVTFDEGDGSDTSPPAAAADVQEQTALDAALENRVAMIVVTKCGRPAVNETPMNHFSLLATLEDGFALPRLRHSIAAPTLMNLVNKPCPP